MESFSEEELEEILFPHKEVREHQDKLIKAVSKALAKKKNLIVHAPTGLGKTAATLAPALAFAQKNDLTVFFLTSRHTQHKIAVETMKRVKQRFGDEFIATSIIGKHFMCGQDAIENLRSSEFHEYCKSMIEGKKCEFYVNTYKSKNPTAKSAEMISKLKKIGPMACEKLIEICKEEKLCPYEIATQLASKARVIITDYYYIFNPEIRKIFFTKTGKSLDKCIIIVDEGHNLPSRVRDLMTASLTSFMTKNALKEAKKFGYNDLVPYLANIQETLLNFSAELDIGKEKLVTKKEFVKKIEEFDPDKEYDELFADLAYAGDAIRQSQRSSFIGSIADFLEAWIGQDDGYARIMTVKQGKREPYLMLSYRCLDPSLVTTEVIKESHNTIMMSGTLQPTEMYADLLGFEDKETMEEEFDSPFPEDNKLSLIIPKTTTKYSARSEEQYKEIAKILVEVTDAVPGNSAVFFPSYMLRNAVNKYFQFESKRTVFKEIQEASKGERDELLENFKNYSSRGGAVLLGTTSGSFGEGIDLPGDLLKAVVVVGLPLNPPDLETRELIKYYDENFGQGWNYGYTLPAFIKTLQNTGRCIRSETDKGVIVFLDERYTWPNYFRLFPKDMNLKISLKYKEEIEGFFKNYKENIYK